MGKIPKLTQEQINTLRNRSQSIDKPETAEEGDCYYVDCLYIEALKIADEQGLLTSGASLALKPDNLITFNDDTYVYPPRTYEGVKVGWIGGARKLGIHFKAEYINKIEVGSFFLLHLKICIELENRNAHGVKPLATQEMCISDENLVISELRSCCQTWLDNYIKEQNKDKYTKQGLYFIDRNRESLEALAKR